MMMMMMMKRIVKYGQSCLGLQKQPENSRNSFEQALAVDSY